jgi:hypothetical protein
MNDSFYQSPFGCHRHRCGNCHHIWEHSDDMMGNEEEHKCPECKEEQWTKYFGSGAPVTKSAIACRPCNGIELKMLEKFLIDIGLF